MRPAVRGGPLVLLVACAACGASCAGDPGTTIDISFRKPSDPTFLDGVDAFVFSVEDAGGQLLVLRRFAPAQALRLDDVPFGRQLSFALDGLFMDTPIIEGRSCATDIIAGAPPPHVAMFLGAVGTFSPTVAPPAGLALAGSLALPRQDGRVLVAGGRTMPDGAVVSSAQQYDARSGLWATDHDLPIPRANAAWAALPGGALVVGGVGLDRTPVGQIDRYDEVTGFHLILSDSALALTELAVAALPGGSVLIAGGASASRAPVNLAWLYDEGGVRALGGMVTARRTHTLSVVGTGNFTAAFAIGGFGADGLPLGSIELYDARGTSSLAFSLKTPGLAFPRGGHTATVLRTGEILIAGGLGADSAPLRAAEIFDPITSTVRPAGTLADGRVGHTATLLGDGRVLVAGGVGASGPLASAEIYDPAVGNFAAARSLGIARVGHAAAALCDGTVLFVGGAPGAELYRPKR